MEGHDAQGTGHSDGEAPAWDDVALQVKVPPPLPTVTGLTANSGGLGEDSNLVLSGAVAYDLAQQGSCTFAPTTPRQLVLRGLNLVDGSSHELARLNVSTGGVQAALAGDGQRLFVVAGYQLFIYDVANRSMHAPIVLPAISGSPTPMPSTISDSCNFGGHRPGVAVAGGRVFVAIPPTPGSGNGLVQVFAIDAVSGKVDGPWTDILGPDPKNLGVVSSYLQTAWQVAGLVASRGIVVVTAYEVDYESYPGTPIGIQSVTGWVLAIDAVAGKSLWTRTLEACSACESSTAPPLVAPSMILGERVLFKFIDLKAFDLKTGAPTASNAGLRSGIEAAPDFGSGMAAAGGHAFAAVSNRLYALDENLNPLWPAAFEIPGQTWQNGGLVASGGVVFGLASSSDGGPSTLYALDAVTGLPIWPPHRFAQANRMLADDGIIVAYGADGTFTVLGKLPSSLRVDVNLSTSYPTPGDSVSVNLRGTAAISGDATAYRADWGDGHIDEWQPSPNLNHVYGAAGDRGARFYARNAGNQTASIPVTFHVGQIDPSLNIIERQFQPDRANQTFFVLGLLATALAAAAGILLRGRKRRRMHRELQHLEAVFRQKRDEPEACQRDLQDCKQHFRDLLAKRKLEEDQFGILTDRADDLLGRIRMNTVEEDFSYLPLGVARTLQRMLRDGRVTAAERSFVLNAVKQDQVLSSAQKAKVTAQVEAWFRSDAGA